MDWRFWRRKEQQPVAQPSCCNASTWTNVADFGHGGGFDFDLGRCSACGSYVLCVDYHGASGYHRLTDERAAFFLSLQKEDPQRLRLILRK